MEKKVKNISTHRLKFLPGPMQILFSSSALNYSLILFIGFALFSCDAMLTLPYRVQNKTGNTVKLRVRSYPAQHRIHGGAVDTIIFLKPNSYVTVAYFNGVGFPWETRAIYKKKRGAQNFELLHNDSVIPLNTSDKNWKYRSGASVFKIRKLVSR